MKSQVITGYILDSELPSIFLLVRVEVLWGDSSMPLSDMWSLQSFLPYMFGGMGDGFLVQVLTV